MNILISIHNVWADLIFQRVKPFEFRTSLPKKLAVGDKVFIYETAKNGGQQKVVGEFTVGGLSDIHNASRAGCIPFLEYYTRNILHNEDLYQLVCRCMKIKTPYKQEMVFRYMFSEELLDYMELHHDIPPIGVRSKYFKNTEDAERLLKECDDWLTMLGYYNIFGVTNYQAYIEVLNPVRYDNPKPLNDFVCGNGRQLKRAPQSWCYVRN